MSEYIYIPDGIKFDPDGIFVSLWDALDWEKRPDAPRKECWMNDYERPYTYGRGRGQRTYESRKMNHIVHDIRLELLDRLRIYFEGCFANGYNGERDHLGWHSDDDPGIDHAKPIVVVSYGASREIQVRPIGSKNVNERLSFVLSPGSIFIMSAGSQFTHQHSIPKVNRVIGPRLSLTYRGLIV